MDSGLQKAEGFGAVEVAGALPEVEVGGEEGGVAEAALEEERKCWWSRIDMKVMFVDYNLDSVFK